MLRLDSLANVTPRHAFSLRIPSPTENTVPETLDEIKSIDLDIFLRKLELIQNHYIKCSSNLGRIKATVQIVKEFEVGP